MHENSGSNRALLGTQGRRPHSYMTVLAMIFLLQAQLQFPESPNKEFENNISDSILHIIHSSPSMSQFNAVKRAFFGIIT